MAYVKPTNDDNQAEIVPTWDTHYFLPIAQNITGGAVVSALAYIGVIAYTGFAADGIDFYNAAVWCALMGGAVACVLTIVRFFGDEWGLFTAAYSAGYHARDAQIAALELELRASYDTQSAAEASGNTSSVMNKRQELMQRTRKDAIKIIQVAFQGDSTTRDAMKARDMGQRDWERAYRLLIACGVMRDDGIIVATSPREAMQVIDEQMTADGQAGERFFAKWQ